MSAEIQNPGEVADAWQAKKQKDRERTADRAKDLSTEKWLEQELDKQASPFSVYNREFLFRPISNEAVKEALEVASSEMDKIDVEDVDGIEDIDTNDLEDMPHLITTMRDTLDDHQVGVPEHADYEPMSSEDWKKIPFSRLEELFERVAAGTGMSRAEAERAKSFRQE